MHRAVCPGSFDPLHNGHLEIISRASKLFDELIVAVSTNYSKKFRFSEDVRVAMARETLAHLPSVTVVAMGNGLLAEFCQQQVAEAIVKGLRSSQDFSYELPMAIMNRQLAGVETVFLPAESTLSHVSSTMIKEVFDLGGNVSDFVPDVVARGLAESAN